MTLIRYKKNKCANNIIHLQNVLTDFAPKRSVYFLLFLFFGLVACSDPSEEISGVYETTLTTTSNIGTEQNLADSLNGGVQSVIDQEKTFRLVLQADQRAEFTIEYLDNTPSIVQKGTWELTDSQRVKTYFVDKNGKFFKDTLSFRSEGLRLILRGQNSSITDEIILLKQAESK